MTEAASVISYQTVETYVPGSIGRMLSGIHAIVIDENGKGNIKITFLFYK